MTPLRELRAIAAPLLRDDVDTDQIVPVSHMVAALDGSLANGLFAHWRFDEQGRPRPDFVLNHARYERAQVLLVGANFGCGSSREHAVWALRDFGIRCIVGVSFAEIFAANCRAQGLLLVRLPRADVEALAVHLEEAAGDDPMTVDVAAQQLALGARRWHFALDPGLRERLLAGRDEIDDTLSLHEAVARWEASDRGRRPWIHRPLAAALVSCADRPPRANDARQPAAARGGEP